ncbi:hypothetical protein Ddye_013480 [Dipteronia dyeriana]|uniref:Late embryogenesis abundant protein LEA-2 subgroup domain-containing protein n=1 Tax=Dipteronia dyeriana TaxID=168575 RepID=A0AAD9X6G8_9ROSI|nr:hypothetical protein Ddye_013480 [Dipteronia dyeriana]
MCNTDRCCALFWPCILILACVVLFGQIFFPEYHSRDPNFEVDSVTINPFDMSNNSSSHKTTTTTHCNITFFVQNRNKKSFPLYFKDIKASIFYKKENISSIEIRPFFQLNPKENILVNANFVVSSEDMDSSVANSIVQDWKSGVVGFNVVVRGTVKIDPWTDVEENYLISVSCEEIKVGFSSNVTTGSMSGGSRKCHVVLLNPFHEVDMR